MVADPDTGPKCQAITRRIPIYRISLTLPHQVPRRAIRISWPQTSAAPHPTNDQLRPQISPHSSATSKIPPGTRATPKATFKPKSMSRIPQAHQATALLYHARTASPFFSKDGQPCASVPASLDSRSVLPIRSAAFRDWLTAAFYKEYEIAPSPVAFRSAIRVLEARAKHGDFPSEKLDHRLGFEGESYSPSKIILDLANPSGQVLEMDSQGWRIRDNMRHSFRQSITTLALPRPLAPREDHPETDQSPWRQFAQLFSLDDSEFARIAAWLVNALRPAGPYPILVLEGSAAGGKSTLARALRALIDPSPALVRRLPDRDEELPAYAFQNWVLAFDDAYRFPPKIADALD